MDVLYGITQVDVERTTLQGSTGNSMVSGSGTQRPIASGYTVQDEEKFYNNFGRSRKAGAGSGTGAGTGTGSDGMWR